MPPQPVEFPNIEPFDDHAVKDILAGVRGNLRGFLQTCHEAFRLAAPTSSRITVDVVMSINPFAGERTTIRQDPQCCEVGRN
jgi:hypothetical protein